MEKVIDTNTSTYMHIGNDGVMHWIIKHTHTPINQSRCFSISGTGKAGYCQYHTVNILPIKYLFVIQWFIKKKTPIGLGWAVSIHKNNKFFFESKNVEYYMSHRQGLPVLMTRNEPLFTRLPDVNVNINV